MVIMMAKAYRSLGLVATRFERPAHERSSGMRDAKGVTLRADGSRQTQAPEDRRRRDGDRRGAAGDRGAGRERWNRDVVLRTWSGSHPLRGSRLRLSVVADRRRRTELDDWRVEQSVQPDRRIQG